MNNTVSPEVLTPFIGQQTKVRPRLQSSLLPGIVVAVDVLIVMMVGVGSSLGYQGWFPEFTQKHLAVTAIAAIAIGTLHYHGKLCDLRTIGAWPDRLPRLVLLSSVVFLVLIVAAFALKMSSDFSRVWFFSTWLISVTLCVLARFVLKGLCLSWGRTGLLVRNIAIVGAGSQANEFIHRLQNEFRSWVRVVGVFDDRMTRVKNHIGGVPVLGDIDALEQYVRGGHIDEVVFALPWSADRRLLELVARLRDLPVNIFLGPDLVGYRFSKRPTEYWDQAHVLEIAAAPLSNWNAVLKGIEDKLLAGALVLLFGPLMLLIAVVVKLDSAGPALFRQKRYGFNNEIINVFKFRTMYAHPLAETHFVQATRGDPRITRVGGFLRRTSLDELPQLFNVLLGSMSMVGPRPHPIELNKKFSQLIGGYYGRHKVKPGITGWAQVNGHRGETETIDKMRTRVEFDVYYIENWSVGLDLLILVKTAFVGWVHRNAY